MDDPAVHDNRMRGWSLDPRLAREGSCIHQGAFPLPRRRGGRPGGRWGIRGTFRSPNGTTAARKRWSPAPPRMPLVRLHRKIKAIGFERGLPGRSEALARQVRRDYSYEEPGPSRGRTKSCASASRQPRHPVAAGAGMGPMTGDSLRRRGSAPPGASCRAWERCRAPLRGERGPPSFRGNAGSWTGE